MALITAGKSDSGADSRSEQTVPAPRLVVEGGLCDEIFFSVGGEFIVCHAYGGVGAPARLWSLATGEEEATGKPFEPYRPGAAPAATSPDSRLVVRAEHTPEDDVYFTQYHVVIADARTGEQLHRFEGFGPLAFTPDGESLLGVASVPPSKPGALNQNPGHLAVWEVSTGRMVRAFPDIEAPRNIALSPDGRTLAAAVAGEEGRLPIRLFDFETGRELRSLAGHPRYGGYSSVRLLAFSPDSRLLASVNDETEVRLWDVQAGEELCNLRGHRRNVTGLAFHPEGRMLATASEDGYVRVWDVNDLLQTNRGGPAGEAATSVPHNFLLSGVAYRAGRRNSFVGDLFITPRSVYYFPQRNTRHEGGAVVEEEGVGPDEMISLFGAADESERGGGEVWSRTLLREAVAAGDGAEKLLDGLLGVAREKEYELSRRELMLPFRVRRCDIKDVSLSPEPELRLVLRDGRERLFRLRYDDLRAARAAFGLAAPDYQKAHGGGTATRSPVSVFPCPRCREFIRYGVEKCRWCKSPVDSEEAAAAYAREERFDDHLAHVVLNAHELLAWFSIPLKLYWIGAAGALLFQLIELSEVRGVKDFFVTAALKAAIVFLPLSPVLPVFWFLLARWHLKYGRTAANDPLMQDARRFARTLLVYLIVITLLTAAVWLVYAYGDVTLPRPIP